MRMLRHNMRSKRSYTCLGSNGVQKAVAVSLRERLQNADRWLLFQLTIDPRREGVWIVP